MKLLIINTGSSSIKFQLLEMPAERLHCSGIAERIGSGNSELKYHSDQMNLKQNFNLKNHREGLQKIVEFLIHGEKGVIRDKNEIEIVAHRVVHGGRTFSDTTLINEEIKKKIRDLIPLAPLHNPHNLEGILVAEEFFPNARQVAVFDTAFHQTIPEKAKKYAIPNHLYSKEGIQVYGFHGISHQYVSGKAIPYLRLKKTRLITIHLGNGCSMTAVKNGKSIDHSMGFTPSNGLIMGSRSGDIDQGLIFYLIDQLGYDPEEVNTLLNKKSGMLGLTGQMDLRDIQAQSEKGNAACTLALEMNAYRIKKYIGAYAAAMNGLDAIVFTAGIGENSAGMRKLVCMDMNFLGIELSEDKNNLHSDLIREVNTDASKVKILVIPTNEELEMARQAFGLVQQLK